MAAEQDTYRANRKTFFLTYSQCPLEPEEVLKHLQTKGEISRYLIGQEKHLDGGLHLHAFIDYDKKKNFKTCRWADVLCPVTGKVYHPNDKGTVRSEAGVAKYCSKESKYITNFWQPKQDLYCEAMSLQTPEMAFQHIVKNRPRDVALYGDRIEANFKRMMKKPKVMPTPVIELRPEQLELIEKFREQPEPRKIFWIWSSTTGAGKSTFKKYVYTKFQVLMGARTLRDTLYPYLDQDIIWFDVPRQQPLDADFTAQLEDLANQDPLVSTKYATITKVVQSHIVVTCNRPPPHDKLPGRLIEYDWNGYGDQVPQQEFNGYGEAISFQ